MIHISRVTVIAPVGDSRAAVHMHAVNAQQRSGNTFVGGKGNGIIPTGVFLHIRSEQRQHTRREATLARQRVAGSKHNVAALRALYKHGGQRTGACQHKSQSAYQRRSQLSFHHRLFSFFNS